MVHFGPVGRSEHQRVVGEGVGTGQSQHEARAEDSGAGCEGCLAGLVSEHPQAPQDLGEPRESGCTVVP